MEFWKRVCHARRNAEGVENFPAHKWNSVMFYIASAQRYTNVKKCVCVVVQREFCFQPLLSIPLWIWSYYYGKLVLFVSARVHTHCWSSWCQRCVKVRVSSTHAGQEDDASL